MASSELRAAFRSTADDAGPLLGSASDEMATVAETGAATVEGNAGRQLANNATQAGKLLSAGDLDGAQDQAAGDIEDAAAPAAAGGTGGAGGGSRISDILGGSDEPPVPSAAIDNPAGVPGPSLSPNSYNAQRLGTLDESVVTRDGSGLIDSVHGQPVDDYLKSLSEERGGLYQQAKDAGTISRRAQGNSIATGLDRRTGAVYEGVNGRAGDIIPDGDVHPTLQANRDAIAANGPYQWEPDAPLDKPTPSPDDPLGHGEVKATNMALWDRTAQGLPDDASALEEMTMAPVFPFIDKDAPFCANCTPMLGDVHSATGKLTQPWDTLN